MDTKDPEEQRSGWVVWQWDHHTNLYREPSKIWERNMPKQTLMFWFLKILFAVYQQYNLTINVSYTANSSLQTLLSIYVNSPCYL